MREAWIVEAVRTPVGRYGGALAQVRPDDLAASAIRAVVDRSGIDPALIEDVILGCANQAGEDNRDVARMALLLAGLPVDVGGLDGQPAVRQRSPGGELRRPRDRGRRRRRVHRRRRRVDDAGAVRHGEARRGLGPRRAAAVRHDARLAVRQPYQLAAMHYPYSMGETAENVAERWEVGRDLQDDFALASQQKPSPRSRAAGSTRRLSRSRPRSGKASRSSFRAMSTRARTPHRCAEGLRPAFREGGTVTAGNSSGINDGASAVLLVEASRARELGLKPLARVDVDGCRRRRSRDHGLRPGTRDAQGPRPGRDRGQDLDLVELNEAFASQSSSASTSWGSTRTRST